MKTDHSLEIVEAVVSDSAELLEIQKRAFYRQGMLYGVMSLPPLVQTLGSLKQDFNIHTFLKAVQGDAIVGFVRGCAEDTTCHISRLCVHPDHQNRGIGKVLMRAIEERFRSARRYELFTGHLSRRNLALYEKLGYREFQRKPQSDKVMLICMRKLQKEKL